MAVETGSFTAPETPGLWTRIARLDRVVMAIVAVIALLAVIDLPQARETVGFTAENLWGTAPFVLLSVLIAAYATASGADNLIARAFVGRTVPMIFLAAGFGAVSPFCSCGVIPIIAALLTMGVPLAPVMAFWLASPVMDPSMFVLTTSVLGLDYALAKTIAALGLGLLGGFGIYFATKAGLFAAPLRAGIGDGGCATSNVRTPKPVAWQFWTDATRRGKFQKSALKNLFFLGKWLTLAFVLESVMLSFVPAEWIATALGGQGIAPVAVATLVGVPAYLNGYAALPLVDGLLGQGMQPGAALSFMVAGGVTCIPAAVAVYALVKKPVFAAYVGFALGGSLVAGLIFQAIN